MREPIIIKLLSIDRMMRKCIKRRDANIKDLQTAPTWYPVELLEKIERRIAINNAIHARLERSYQNTLNRLQKL